jgi:serine/threonine protein kinase
MAVKIMEKKDEESIKGEKLAINLRNHNIKKIHKIYEDEKFKEASKDINFRNSRYREDIRDNSSKEGIYDFIIMEKAVLRDLGMLNEFYRKYNLLKLIKNEKDIFHENLGQNLIRFYAREIINSLEALDRNNYVHFDIKPENLAVSRNLNIKLTDFSFLREIKEDIADMKIPGGTPGYITPEYYIYKKINPKTACKQDYFALGSTLFLLKYGIPFLKYKQDFDNMINTDTIINLIEQKIRFLKTQEETDKDFMSFIISLSAYTPDQRPNIQQIVRNKWLNKNNDELDRIIMAFENDEKKFVIELQKSDYLMKKENLKKIENKNFSRINKFRFKKKKKNNLFYKTIQEKIALFN